MAEENLFIQSFHHLLSQPQKEAAQAQKGVLEPTKISIALDKGVVFDNLEAACKYIIAADKEELPPKFRNFVTRNLVRGDVDKQIASIFRDFKKYGKQVAPKLVDFFQFMNQNQGGYLKYLDRLSKGLSPLDCLNNGRVDLVYFKLWFLFNYLKTNKLM